MNQTSADNETVNAIKSLIYRDSQDVDLDETDITWLQSYPVDVVIPILRDIFIHEKNSPAKSRAYRQIIDFPNYDRVQFILDVFDQSTVGWQTVYCEDLSRFPDPRAVVKLCSVILEHPDPNVRFDAAQALDFIGDESALEALDYVSKHDEGANFEDGSVADMAHTGLVKIGHKLNPNIEKFSKGLYFHRGASRQMIEQIEAKYHFRFPEDYREFLLVTNGADGFVGQSHLVIFPLENIDEINEVIEGDGSIPGILVFGTDFCDKNYAFDIRQPVPVFVEISRMNLHIEDIHRCGFTLQEFLAYLFNKQDISSEEA